MGKKDILREGSMRRMTKDGALSRVTGSDQRKPISPPPAPKPPKPAKQDQ